MCLPDMTRGAAATRRLANVNLYVWNVLRAHHHLIGFARAPAAVRSLQIDAGSRGDEVR